MFRRFSSLTSADVIRVFPGVLTYPNAQPTEVSSELVMEGWYLRSQCHHNRAYSLYYMFSNFSYFFIVSVCLSYKN